MNCREYTEHFLSADADGELTPEESRSVDEHLRECAACRERLASERSFKKMMRERLTLAQTPVELKAKILDALDREEQVKVSEFTGMRQAGVLIPLAIAALALIVVATILRGRQVQRVAEEPAQEPMAAQPSGALPSDSLTALNDTIPAFDWATTKFSQFEVSFDSNVQAATAEDLQRQYHEQVQLFPYVWDFSQMGFRLVGGRIEPMKNGTPATFTLYRGAKGDIMCTRYRVDSMMIPRGGRHLNGIHHLYNYKGYTVCMTVENGVCCMLVTRMPVDEFYQGLDRLES